VIGLYLKPPAHAVVFSIDEKTAIQALDRLDPVLPLSPGRAERHGFEYSRHGTLSLYAALEVSSGRVEGMPARRHTSADFLRFLDQLVGHYRRTNEIHVILDNLSAHKTPAAAAWRAAHPNVVFHFTPTYSSWLNQVARWFCQDRTRRDRARHLHLDDRPCAQTAPLYQTAQKPVSRSPGPTTTPSIGFMPSGPETQSTSVGRPRAWQRPPSPRCCTSRPASG
jgi:transposase